MSTLYKITEYGFLYEDAPSDEDIERLILSAVKRHEYALDIYWRDQLMTVDYQPARKYFQGRGWFSGVNVDFIAKGLNVKINRGELTL